MAIPVRLERGKVLSAIDGVVDTWDWFIDFLKGITGSNGIVVKKNASSIDISLEKTDDEEDEDESDDYNPLPDIPEMSPLDLSGFGSSTIEVKGTDNSTATGKKIVFASGSDSNIRAVVSQQDADTVKVTIDVYYK